MPPGHIIFDNVMLYMMFFYTDIFGILPVCRHHVPAGARL
jgi:Na+/melibiose symporter-like transporter